MGLSASWDGPQAVSTFHVPYRHKVLLIATEEPAAIGGEREGQNGTRAVLQSVQTLSACPPQPDLPQLDHTIIAAAGQQPPIGTASHRPDPVVVPLEGREAALAVDLP